MAPTSTSCTDTPWRCADRLPFQTRQCTGARRCLPPCLPGQMLLALRGLVPVWICRLPFLQCEHHTGAGACYLIPVTTVGSLMGAL